MRLIGMLDSPYVRRVAVSLKFLGLPFSQEQVSVFRHFDTFSEINPVVKAPTLVTDDGVTLMDSTLILHYAEQCVAGERRLNPESLADFARAQRIIGLALAACEKTVQLVYEFNLRPEERQHQPWIDRVRGQLRCAYELLETEVEAADGWLFGRRPLQADITAAVAWRFTHHMLPGEIDIADHPATTRLSDRAERLPEFLSTPLD